MADLIANVTEVLNGRARLQIPAVISKWQNIYYSISVHTSGVCPSYIPLRYDSNVRLWQLGVSSVYPVNWLYPEYDAVFDKLFGMHPREPYITRELRKSLYKPYQQAPLIQAMDKCKAIISAPNKYTLVVDDVEDNEYIWGKNFAGKNLVDFMFWHFKAVCEDPNSIFVVTTDRPAKEMKNGKVATRIIHIPTRRFFYFSPDEFIFHETDDLMWYVNGAAYLRFKKDEEGEWIQADGKRGYYAHMLYRLPCHVAGGTWNTHGYYDSYIQPAIPFCDELVGAMSAVQLVNKEAAHPIIIAASTDCPECNATGAYQYCKACNCRTTDGCTCNNPANYRLDTCHSCHGTKQQSHNPGDWMIVPPDQMGNDLVKFINPDVTVNEYLVKYKDDVYESIRASLHQQTIKEAQSGTAKEIDRDGERLWYQSVSNGYWALIEKILIDILSLRNTSKSEGQIKPNIPRYTLIPPTEFDLKTEADLLDEYKVETESKMPDYIRQKATDAYVDKIYGGNDVAVKQAAMVNYLDPYSVTSVADKQVAISAGIADARTMQFSALLPNMLNRLAMKKGTEWFINSSYDTIEAEIKTMFEAIPAPVAPAENTVVKEIV